MTEQIECGFCDGGKMESTFSAFRWPGHTEEPIECPYCYGTGLAPQDDSGEDQ